MSIKNEIERIQFNVSSAYSAVENKGGELPKLQNSDNLAAAIATIPTGTVEAAGFSLYETRIGTWIDGKPLYRRCVLCFDIGAETEIYTFPNEVDFLLSYGYHLESGGTIFPINFANANSYNFVYLSEDRKTAMYSLYRMYADCIVVVFEYTKTTDKATIDISDAIASARARAKAAADAQFSFEQSADGIYASYADSLPSEKWRDAIEREDGE